MFQFYWSFITDILYYFSPGNRTIYKPHIYNTHLLNDWCLISRNETNWVPWIFTNTDYHSNWIVHFVFWLCMCACDSWQIGKGERKNISRKWILLLVVHLIFLISCIYTLWSDYKSMLISFHFYLNWPAVNK